MSATLSFVLLLLVWLCCPSLALADSADVQHWQPVRPSEPYIVDPADCPLRNTVIEQEVEGGAVVNNGWQSELAAARQPQEPRSLAVSSHAVLRAEGETEITPGKYVSGYLASTDTYHYFSYKPAALNVPFDIFVGIGTCSQGSGYFCDIHVYMNGSPYAQTTNATYDLHYYNNIRIDSAHPLSCESRNVPLADCEFHYSLKSQYTGAWYETTIMVPPAGVAEMPSGRPQKGTLDGSASAYFYLVNGQMREVMIFALTVTAGDCDLYVSAIIERPGPNNYTWSSVGDGDDLVIVNGTTAGPGGRTGLYYYVGVYNNLLTGSGYSIVGSGYNAGGNPGNNAIYVAPDVPQKDYVMANTFRYYYAYVDGVWPNGLTITLDSLKGDADIYANIRPGWSDRDERLWPTRTSAQYNSTTTGLDQLNITKPNEDDYVYIGVYSNNVDSRYSILVTGEGRLAPLYVSGYPVTAQVAARRSLYYAATISTAESLSNYVFTLTLRSLSGNADLYISDTYIHPNATHHNWTSEVAGDGLDVAILSGDGRQPQLHSGNYYVAVRGTVATSFQLWSYLRYRQFLRINGLLSYYHYGGVLHYEIDVPRGVGFSIVASPTAYYGGAMQLYVGNIAYPNPSVAATYQVQGRGVVRVTPAASPCMGDGPTCHYYIAVERVHAANETEYASFTLFVYSPDVPYTWLTPSLPFEKTDTAPGGTVYQFNVSCPRSKVTITLMTTESQPVPTSPITLNRGPLPPFQALDNIDFGFDETVAAGRRTFTLTFDWRHPRLRGKGVVGTFLMSVMPPYSSGWTVLVRINDNNCLPLPHLTPVEQLVPYTATVNATSLAYFWPPTPASSNRSVYFTLSPLNSSVSLSGLSLLARVDGNVPAAGYAQFSSSTGVLRVPADACLTGSVPRSVCSYMLAVSSGSTSSASFLLTASLDQPLYAMDGSSSTAVLAGTLSRNTSAAGTAAVPRGTVMVSVITESCTGAVSVYLNYRTAAIPSWSSADVSAVNVTAPTALPVTITNTTATTHLVASIAGYTASAATFQSRLLLGMSWFAASPSATTTALTVTSYSQVTTGYARVRIPLAAVPAAVTAGTIRQPTGSTGQLRYHVFMLDKSVRTDANIRSKCGLMTGAMLAYTGYQLTTSSNTIDLRLPQSTHRYTVVVLVDHVWRTPAGSRNYTYEPSSIGYMSYTPVEVRAGTKQPGGDGEESSSSGGLVPPPAESSKGLTATSILIIVAVALGVTLLAVLIGYWYYKRMMVGGSRSGGESLLDTLGGRSSLPADSFVQPYDHQQQSQQQQLRPTQLTGEAYYGLPSSGSERQ